MVSEEPLTIHTAAEARWNPGGFPDNYHQTDVDQVVDELAPYYNAGGRTLVEVTPSHMSRNPLILREISERSGVHVVMGGGYYLAGEPPARYGAAVVGGHRSGTDRRVDGTGWEKPGSGRGYWARSERETRSGPRRSAFCGRPRGRIWRPAFRSASTCTLGDSKG